MKGRRAEHGEPAVAWQYRRVIALVQALAIEDPIARYAAVGELSRVWRVEVKPGEAIIPGHKLIHRLAKHALEAARKND